MQRPWGSVTNWLVPQGLLGLLFYSTQDYFPRGGIMAWAVHSNHQLRKCSTGLPTGQYVWGIFSVEVPSSKTSLPCVKLTLNWPSQ